MILFDRMSEAEDCLYMTTSFGALEPFPTKFCSAYKETGSEYSLRFNFCNNS